MYKHLYKQQSRNLSPATILRPSAELTRPTIKPGKWLVRLSGLGLLLFFVWRLNFNLAGVVNALAHAQILPILGAIGLILPILGLKTWRWQLLLKGLNAPLKFGLAFRLYALGLAAGSFTPGQLGDGLKAWYLRDRGYRLSTTLFSVVLDRLFDLAVLALLATSGLMLLGPGVGSEVGEVLVLSGGIGLALAFVLVPAGRRRVLGLLEKSLRRKTKTNQAQPGPDLNDHLSGGLLALTFGLTLLTSSLAIARVWLLALALGLDLHWLQTVWVSSLATIAGLLPVSIAGIGTRDLTLLGLMKELGYSSELALSLSSLILMLSLVNLVVGYAIWQVGSFKGEASQHSSAIS